MLVFLEDRPERLSVPEMERERGSPHPHPRPDRRPLSRLGPYRILPTVPHRVLPHPLQAVPPLPSSGSKPMQRWILRVATLFAREPSGLPGAIFSVGAEEMGVEAEESRPGTGRVAPLHIRTTAIPFLPPHS